MPILLAIYPEPASYRSRQGQSGLTAPVAIRDTQLHLPDPGTGFFCSLANSPTLLLDIWSWLLWVPPRRRHRHGSGNLSCWFGFPGLRAPTARFMNMWERADPRQYFMFMLYL